MIAIFKREFRSYMNNVIGYAVIALILLFAGLCIGYQNLMLASPDATYAMLLCQLVLIVAIPVLTMRSMSEEKRNRIDRFLYSLPIKPSSVVLGKYLAMLALLTLSCAILALYPLALMMFGLTSVTAFYLALVGFWLLGAALLALCQFMSSLTDSPIIALLLGFGGVLLSLLCGLLPELLSIGGVAGDVLRSLGLFSRYTALCQGVFDIGTVVFDISVVVLFLFLTSFVMERKRRR